MFLALNLCNQYDDDFVRSLQEQDATGIVNGLCEMMLSSDMVDSNQKTYLHIVSLLRCLFEFSSGRRDALQRQLLDRDRTPTDNLSAYGSLVELGGSAHFGKFDAKEMRNALRNSRAFAGSNLNEGELADLTDRIRRFVPSHTQNGW